MKKQLYSKRVYRKPIPVPQSGVLHNVQILPDGVVAIPDTSNSHNKQTRISSKMPVETTKRYFEDNWEMIQSQPEINSVVTEHIANFFHAGICIFEGGTFLKPTGEFAELIDNAISTALTRAFLWMMCYGYVCWADVVTEENKHTVFVPDPSQVLVEFEENQQTGESVTHVSWTNKKINTGKSKLHMFERSMFGISLGWQCSPLDAVSPHIDFLNRLKITRICMLDRIARPPIPIQESASVGRNAWAGGPGIASSDMPSISRREADQTMSDGELSKKNIDQINRVTESTNAAIDRAADELANLPKCVPIWTRMDEALHEPPENRYVVVTPGMQISNFSAPIHDLDFNATIVSMVLQIERMLGRSTDLMDPTTKMQKIWKYALGALGTKMLKLLYPEKNIKLMLMSQVTEDRDMCALLVAQGAMSEESYMVLHPPPPSEEESATHAKKKTKLTK